MTQTWFYTKLASSGFIIRLWEVSLSKIGNDKWSFTKRISTFCPRWALLWEHTSSFLLIMDRCSILFILWLLWKFLRFFLIICFFVFFCCDCKSPMSARQCTSRLLLLENIFYPSDLLLQPNCWSVKTPLEPRKQRTVFCHCLLWQTQAPYPNCRQA